MPRSWPGACLIASWSTMRPLAIVVVTEHTHGLARLFGALAAADRPIKIFRDARAARRWLEDQSA